jgi:tetratricopeptide (TPR) repeat protein
LTNIQLTDRATVLATISPEFNDLADMARKAKKTAFLHYITAMYANYYNNYERASAEIDKAVRLEPKSARYVGAKGLLLARYGDWVDDDKRIELGIQYLRQSAELPCSEPDLVDEPCERDFQIASAIADLKHPRWQEVAAHYERYLKSTKYKASAYTFAWNNLSIAYRHLGECQKAKDAAEAALKIRTFGAAEMNRNRAEFCLEMQKLGMATNLTKNKR